MKTTDPLAGVMAFLAVAESSSFTKAAESLDIGRATVGAQIRMLEERLGVRLLQRSTRAVSLTEAGKAYREALNGLTDQVGEAERVATSLQTENVGRLKITASPDLGPIHIAPVIARYLNENPGVSIELQLSNGIADLIGNGYDLAIRGALAVEPTLIARKIGASALSVSASPDYLARYGAPMDPKDLMVHACLHFSEVRWGRVWRFEKNGEIANVPIRIAFENNSGSTLLAAAVAGAGIVLLPAFVAGPAIRDGALVPVLADWTLPIIPLQAAYPANRNIARKVRRFVEMLAQDFASHLDLR
ncbi:LysR family transcriptional regulator [Aureimonas phyllosphaerae]|uniref:DNA-binding transcriptional LysR family regulator n=1 Tax=Aureimonas phyllosphaerae TaxID=1166078 RepID=A0A7W6BUN3_9HYPH|nr:LysR family transcriptional regulator [Aureimonas phyllosphaerae]MBB3938333.1 DNA-binding transcriptional LysR family regulator [Aureimonas phyllosphaerae]MBB3962335.1 DNA-binding transcriptional LysR family regulator [Aureimonas phyllosphaerae]SFF60144.1 transcriptional regulator, LysR family [Aureimonas phyllosphaerae]